jgi:carbon storage regulator
MLVLSRQRDESIMIGDDVEITIVDVRGDKVRLGITAPKHIPVHRREIYDAIQREKAQKAEGQGPPTRKSALEPPPTQAAAGDGEPEKPEESTPKKVDKSEKAAQKQQQQ